VSCGYFGAYFESLTKGRPEFTSLNSNHRSCTSSRFLGRLSGFVRGVSARNSEVTNS
jgi:hypothetical protein